MKNLLLIAIIITSTLTSCDIQKKRYSRGFTISKNRNYSSGINKANEIETQKSKQIDSTQFNISKIKLINEPKTIVSKQVINSISNEPVDLKSTETQISKAVNNKVDELENHYHQKKKRNGILRQKKKTYELQSITKDEQLNIFALLSFIFALTLIGCFISYVFAVIASIQISRNSNKYSKFSTLLLNFSLVLYFLTIIIGGLYLLFVLSYGGASNLVVLGLAVLFILFTIAGIVLIFMNESNDKKIKVDKTKEDKSKKEPRTRTSLKKVFLIVSGILLFLWLLLQLSILL